MICEICNSEYYKNRRNESYSLIFNINEYFMDFSSMYDSKYKDHEYSIYDIMLCNDCASTTLRKFKTGKYNIPEYIHIEQSKQYMILTIKKLKNGNKM